MPDANAASSPSAKYAEREVVITRIFDAPRELVFKAWLDPKRLRAWWGPHKFTNPVCELDARVGGKWHVVMRGPNGMDYPCGGVYREIVEPERLVFTNIATDDKGNPIIDGLTIVTFEEQNGKTKLTLKTRGTALVDYAAAYLTGMEAGWTQSLERLAEHLHAQVKDAPNAADREIIITRVFDAPRELIFQVWTDPKHVAQWWGPRGFSTTISEMDVRPGGFWRVVMRGPDGTDYKNKIVFLEVVKPERLVYKHEPEKNTEPSTHQSIVTFEEQPGQAPPKTKVTMRMIFKSAAAKDHIVKKYNAIEGGNQTLDRLGEHLAKNRR